MFRSSSVTQYQCLGPFSLLLGQEWPGVLSLITLHLLAISTHETVSMILFIKPVIEAMKRGWRICE